jgi:hypothetical protein
MTKWKIGISARLLKRTIDYRYNVDRHDGEEHVYKLFMMMSYGGVLMLNYDSAGIEINKISYPRGLAYIGEDEPSFKGEKWTEYYHLHLAVSRHGIE